MDYRTDLEIHPRLIHARVPGCERAFDPETCLAPDADRSTLLVMGDSHAEHLMFAFEEAFPELNVQLAGSTGCTPTIDVEGDWYCPRVICPVLHEHVTQGGVDVVLLSARWEDGEMEPLRETVEHLLGYVDEVVTLGPTPEYQGSFPAILARNLRRGGSDDLSRFLDPEVRRLDHRMAAADWGGSRYVSLYELICPDECRLLTEDGVSYLADYGHHTRAAAREIVADLARMAVVTVSKGKDETEVEGPH